MPLETEAITGVGNKQEQSVTPKVNPQERRRTIAHLGRMFARRYDMEIIPSGQKGVWACSLDPKVIPIIKEFIEGERQTIRDLPEGSFRPKQILYDEETAMKMQMDDIIPILRHEAGHAKYSDFSIMLEGQKRTKDEGYLPTSFLMVYEGLEDPRVNNLEGEESPAIDKQIRELHIKELGKRLSETPIKQMPLLAQFMYNSIHHWLYGEGIPELKDTEVGQLYETAKPLLDRYFQSTDAEEQRELSKGIWNITKVLEKKEQEQEEMRQIAQQKGMYGQGDQPQLDGGQGTESKTQESSEQISNPLKGGQDTGKQQTRSPQTSQKAEGQPKESTTGTEDIQKQKPKSLLEKLKEAFSKEKGDQQPKDHGGLPQTEENSVKSTSQKHERDDLSKLTPEQIQDIKDSIDKLSPKERIDLAKKARNVIDELQKQELEKKVSKTFKLKMDKNGEYQIVPNVSDSKMQEKARGSYQDIVQQVEAEEQEEFARQEQERLLFEQVQKQLEEERKQQQEMKKAGFNEDERDKFLLYQQLEDAMYPYVRRFKEAIEKIVPRKKEMTYEGGHFSGPKFERRALVRKAPIGDESFHMRPIDRPTGEPRLFIGLLVDNSISMSGQKIDEARKTMIFFSKACNDLGIPFMMTAFGDSTDIVKSFRQDFENPAERVKPKLIDLTNADGKSTNLYDGIEKTVKEMNEQRRMLKDSHGLIFVISDGDANTGLTGRALRNYIDENRGRLTFKAFGLSGDQAEKEQIQSHLNLYFGEGNCAYPENFEDLPDETYRILRVNLMQFQRFLT